MKGSIRKWAECPPFTRVYVDPAVVNVLGQGMAYYNPEPRWFGGVNKLPRGLFVATKEIQEAIIALDPNAKPD